MEMGGVMNVKKQAILSRVQLVEGTPLVAQEICVVNLSNIA